jgi:hypothetical protein
MAALANDSEDDALAPFLEWRWRLWKDPLLNVLAQARRPER